MKELDEDEKVESALELYRFSEVSTRRRRSLKLSCVFSILDYISNHDDIDRIIYTLPLPQLLKSEIIDEHNKVAAIDLRQVETTWEGEDSSKLYEYKDILSV